MKLVRLPLLVFFFLSAMLVSCRSSVDVYIEQNPTMSTEKRVAMRNGQVINGMTKQEVELVLGKPTFIDRKSGPPEPVRWIYREVSGVTEEEAYQHDSAFPQGIGYVIPLNYRCREIRVDFEDDKVCRVQRILSF